MNTISNSITLVISLLIVFFTIGSFYYTPSLDNYEDVDFTELNDALVELDSSSRVLKKLLFELDSSQHELMMSLQDLEKSYLDLSNSQLFLDKVIKETN